MNQITPKMPAEMTTGQLTTGARLYRETRAKVCQNPACGVAISTTCPGRKWCDKCAPLVKRLLSKRANRIQAKRKKAAAA